MTLEGRAKLEREERLLLLSAFSAATTVRSRQVFWFIEHEPRTFLGLYPCLATESDIGVNPLYDEGVRRWHEAVARNPDDVDVREAAAWYMILAEPTKGAVFLEQAGSVAGPWPYRAAAYYGEAARLNEPSRPALLRRGVNVGLSALSKVVDLWKFAENVGHPADIIDMILGFARTAGLTEVVKTLTLSELALVREERPPEDRAGISSFVRGLAALSSGDNRAAEDALNELARTPKLSTRAILAFAERLRATGADEKRVHNALRSRRDLLVTEANEIEQWLTRNEE